MKTVCFYFQVHQPIRLRRFSFFDIGVEDNYEDGEQNESILAKVAEKCYIPANKCMLKLIKEFGGDFRISYSVTGVLLDELEKHCPKVIESFKKLADTGCVEFLAETYHHTLAFLFSRQEFKRQVRAHRQRIKDLFGTKPTAFRNTELIYNDDVAASAESMGFKVVLAEGTDKILGRRDPNFVYTPDGRSKIKLLLRNYRLSDDIAFRFSSDDWGESPLTSKKFARWIHRAGTDGEVVNFFIDYETLGEHQWKESGIFKFFETLPKEILKKRGFRFLTPTEVVSEHEPAGELAMPDFVSWADTDRDLSAWKGNELQEAALEAIYGLRKDVTKTGKKEVLETWRRLQTSDHFYYMCTKWSSDGDVHKYFNPYLTPYDAFTNYMSVIADFSERVRA